MLKRLVCCLLLISFFSRAFVFASAPMAEVFVTDVTVQPDENNGKADIIINNILELKDIEVLRNKSGIALRFPEYVSRSKKVYPQIKIKSLKVEESIRKAVESGASASPQSSELTYRITKFRVFNSERSSIKAFASVLFNNSIEVEVKLMEGSNGTWVAWPARKDDKTSNWIRQVDLTDKKLKEQIETELLGKYEGQNRP
jgi:DNA-binding cell septation regulator SpoVG